MYLYNGILPSIEINYGNMDKSSPKNYTECKTLDKRAMCFFISNHIIVSLYRKQTYGCLRKVGRKGRMDTKNFGDEKKNNI